MVKDEATMKEPHKISAGIERVWVNGVVVFENKKATGKYPGSVIKRQ
ncbi:MAG: hypothetical protein HZB42_02575 [Sphingobacteriales bacterium]|nr:hypothetical protein [Sphingobacteriales bacterium]